MTTISTTPVGSYPITVTGTGASATHSTTFTLNVTGSTGTAPQLVQSAGSSTKTVTLPHPARRATSWCSRLVCGPVSPADHGGQRRKEQVDQDPGDGRVGPGLRRGDLVRTQRLLGEQVTVTTNATAVALNLQEYSGVATSSPLDGSNGSAGDSATAASGSVTPTGSNDLAVGYIAGHGNSEAISITSPGFTALSQQNTTSPNLVSVKSGYQDLSSTAAQSFSGSYPASQYWSSGIALFKASSSGAPPPNDFSISASPTSASVSAGTSATSTINTAVSSGVAQSVALSATGLPQWVARRRSPRPASLRGQFDHVHHHAVGDDAGRAPTR